MALFCHKYNAIFYIVQQNSLFKQSKLPKSKKWSAKISRPESVDQNQRTKVYNRPPSAAGQNLLKYICPVGIKAIFIWSFTMRCSPQFRSTSKWVMGRSLATIHFTQHLCPAFKPSPQVKLQFQTPKIRSGWGLEKLGWACFWAEQLKLWLKTARGSCVKPRKIRLIYSSPLWCKCHRILKMDVLNFVIYFALGTK